MVLSKLKYLLLMILFTQVTFFYYNNQFNGDGVLHSKIKFMFFLLHKFVYNIQNNWNVRFPLYKCETNKI